MPAPPQSVEVLPGQLMTIYPTVAPQQLFGAGQTGPPLMARVGAGKLPKGYFMASACKCCVVAWGGEGDVRLQQLFAAGHAAPRVMARVGAGENSQGA